MGAGARGKSVQSSPIAVEPPGFALEKETKNTIRCVEKPETGKPPAIGTICIQKWALPVPITRNIAVTVGA